MEFNEIIKYLVENLTVEVSTTFEGCDNNQEIQVSLKLCDIEISKSSSTIFIDNQVF